jgi:hypothetical protein
MRKCCASRNSSDALISILDFIVPGRMEEREDQNDQFDRSKRSIFGKRDNLKFVVAGFCQIIIAVFGNVEL